jgi:hypothetical protein
MSHGPRDWLGREEKWRTAHSGRGRWVRRLHHGDRGIAHEQNLSARTIAVILIRSKSSRLSDLQLSVADVLMALNSIRPGELIRSGV